MFLDDEVSTLMYVNDYFSILLFGIENKMRNSPLFKRGNLLVEAWVANKLA